MSDIFFEHCVKNTHTVQFPVPRLLLCFLFFVFCCVSSERLTVPSSAAPRRLIKLCLYPSRPDRLQMDTSLIKGESFHDLFILATPIHTHQALEPLPHMQTQYLCSAQGNALTAEVSLNKMTGRETFYWRQA